MFGFFVSAISMKEQFIWLGLILKVRNRPSLDIEIIPITLTK